MNLKSIFLLDESVTYAIFISHITSPTALIFPVVEICRRARQAGLLTIVDGAHASRQIDLILSEGGRSAMNCCARRGAGSRS